MTHAYQTLGLQDNAMGVYLGGVERTVTPVKEVGLVRNVTHTHQTSDPLDLAICA